MTITITNRHGDEISVGQLWTDDHRRTAQRTLRIDAIDHTHATCTVLFAHDTSTGEITAPGRVVRIKLDSLHTTPAGNGYRRTDFVRPDGASAIIDSKTPKRIQRRRTKGWRMPAGAVYVGRGSRWGNPFVLGEAQVRIPALDGSDWEREGRLYKTSGERHPFHTTRSTITWHQVEDATAEQCVEMYREYITGQTGRLAFRHPNRTAEIREHLAGLDLACWCPLDRPCHADVLLEIANGDTL